LSETVEHVLIQCSEYNREISNFIETLEYVGINKLTLNSIFQNAQEEKRVYSALIKYLRETGLVDRIGLYIFIYLFIYLFYRYVA